MNPNDQYEFDALGRKVNYFGEDNYVPAFSEGIGSANDITNSEGGGSIYEHEDIEAEISQLTFRKTQNNSNLAISVAAAPTTSPPPSSSSSSSSFSSTSHIASPGIIPNTGPGFGDPFDRRSGEPQFVAPSKSIQKTKKEPKTSKLMDRK